MQKVRTILRPATEGTHFTVAEARRALRELQRETRLGVKKKALIRRKPAAKAG